MVTKHPRPNQLMAVPDPNMAPHRTQHGRPGSGKPVMDTLPGADWTATLDDGPERKQAEKRRAGELRRVPGSRQAQQEDDSSERVGSKGKPAAWSGFPTRP